VREVRSCAVAVASIRAEPDPAAEQVTQAVRREPLTVLERRPGWARVTNAYDYPGWIVENVLGAEPATEWLPSRRGRSG